MRVETCFSLYWLTFSWKFKKKCSKWKKCCTLHPYSYRLVLPGLRGPWLLLPSVPKAPKPFVNGDPTGVRIWHFMISYSSFLQTKVQPATWSTCWYLSHDVILRQSNVRGCFGFGTTDKLHSVDETHSEAWRSVPPWAPGSSSNWRIPHLEVMLRGLCGPQQLNATLH